MKKIICLILMVLLTAQSAYAKMKTVPFALSFDDFATQFTDNLSPKDSYFKSVIAEGEKTDPTVEIKSRIDALCETKWSSITGDTYFFRSTNGVTAACGYSGDRASPNSFTFYVIQNDSTESEFEEIVLFCAFMRTIDASIDTDDLSITFLALKEQSMATVGDVVYVFMKDGDTSTLAAVRYERS